MHNDVQVFKSVNTVRNSLRLGSSLLLDLKHDVAEIFQRRKIRPVHVFEKREGAGDSFGGNTENGAHIFIVRLQVLLVEN